MDIATVEVYAGTNKTLGNDAVINFISEIYVHPNYVPSSCPSRLYECRNNIALARLRNYYKLEKLISPIKLVTPQQKYQAGILVGVGNIYCNPMLDRSCMGIKYKQVFPEEKQYIRSWNIKRIRSAGVLLSEENGHSGRFPWKDLGAPLICNCSKEVEPVQFGLLASIWTNSSTDKSSELNIYESVAEHLWFITQYLSNVKEFLIKAKKLSK
ncbi:hypothetical protein ILUMI_13817 [Ignelater luminosus]|uniref:Peptidase S1 domain-containing protein n=1 Tax=Ignelater luminosus TaxID=2038154 RepID=A0A8K0CXS0_IGNLU|nr:hypothetical protein ILUMI_13817 [Ignelater luminosus]